MTRWKRTAPYTITTSGPVDDFDMFKKEHIFTLLRVRSTGISDICQLFKLIKKLGGNTPAEVPYIYVTVSKLDF